MAGLEALTAMIYHERQQEGSMLCAQHALNSLLQGPYFTAPDLAAIADSFDVLEHDAMQGSSQRSTSRNMDDTGFFSVQVMDKALDVWGLHLLRWRSEQMRPYQDAPHKQLAFVLNLEQHWFTLRRFGPARTEPDSDPGEGHWFNLNSHYPAPNWVSKTYLDMFLRQSEEEGYSVFVVVQADPHKPLALPRTEADLAAATLDAPDSMPGAYPREAPATGQVVIPDEGEYDINSEDVELQAALAASLTGADHSFGQHAYVPQAPVPAPPLRRAPVPPVIPGDDDDEEGDDDVMEVDSVPVSASASASASTTAVNANPDPEDPVAASMARNREMLERMKRIQEAALRETYEEEMAGLRPQTGLAPPAQRRQTRAEQEREELERAIAASIAAAGTSHSSPNAGDEGEDEDEDVEEIDKENAGTRRHEPVPQASSASVPSAPAPVPARPQAGESHRVYDDEDEQLQAALRASLETMPEDYVHPPSPPGPPPPRHASTLPVGSGLSPLAPLQAPAESTSTTPSSVDESSEASQSKTKEEDTEEDEGPSSPPAQVDVEEMRKRRLARFGGQG